MMGTRQSIGTWMMASVLHWPHIIDRPGKASVEESPSRWCEKLFSHSRRWATRLPRRARVLIWGALTLPLLGGCTRISVDPECPTNLEVGDRLDLSANATDEGGIPTFEWTVIPETAGEFDNPDRQDTDFVAREAGPATIRLFASDGLFTTTAECQVQIGAGGLIVELAFSPEEPRTGEEVTLVCESLGGVVAEELTIEQDEGPEVTLTPGAEGEATFTPTEAGAYSFSCTGTAGSDSSEPSSVSITVRSTRPPR